jgi:hypothetical protein
MVWIPGQGHDLTFRNRCQHAAGVGAIEGTDCFPGDAHNHTFYDKIVFKNCFTLDIIHTARKITTSNQSVPGVFARHSPLDSIVHLLLVRKSSLLAEKEMYAWHMRAPEVRLLSAHS